MMPAVTREWGLNVPLGPTRKTWAWVMSQWGVSVAGFIRPRTAAVHSVTNQVRGLPLGDFGRPWPLTVTVWPGASPWLGVTLTTRPAAPASAGKAKTAEPTAPTRATPARDHPRMPRTSEPGRLPGHPEATHLSTAPLPKSRALGPSSGRTPAMGRSGNLNAHPFGGGVIGNTTGSGPVIEGSSPSPRAPAASYVSWRPPPGPIV